MNLKLCGLAAAIALAFATTAQAQSTTTTDRNADRPATTKTERAPSERKVKNAEEEKIEADYKAAKAQCDAMKGNQKDVCMKEAKGKEKVAKAELDAKHDNSPRAQEKDACQKDAKAKRDQAMASVKKAEARKENASRGSSTDTAARTK